MENARRKPSPTRTAVASIALLLVLAACGQSGPLYLPDEPAHTVPQPVEPAPPADEEKEEDGVLR